MSEEKKENPKVKFNKLMGAEIDKLAEDKKASCEFWDKVSPETKITNAMCWESQQKLENEAKLYKEKAKIEEESSNNNNSCPIES